MAQYNITLDDAVLKGLFSGDKGMSELLEQVLNQVSQAQATEQVQAQPYERADERQGYQRYPTTPAYDPCRHAHTARPSASKR